MKGQKFYRHMEGKCVVFRTVETHVDRARAMCWNENSLGSGEQSGRHLQPPIFTNNKFFCVCLIFKFCWSLQVAYLFTLFTTTACSALFFRKRTWKLYSPMEDERWYKHTSAFDIRSSSGKRRKIGNNRRKKEAEKRTDEKEATKLNQRNFNKEYVI